MQTMKIATKPKENLYVAPKTNEHLKNAYIWHQKQINKKREITHYGETIAQIKGSSQYFIKLLIEFIRFRKN